MKGYRHSHAVAGLAMGGGAVLLWSLSSPCIVFAGKQVGVWQFLAMTSSLGGVVQILAYLALGRELRSILMPPPKLWIAMVLGFVLYLLLYTGGLVTSHTERQAVGVSLMNYLWPTFSVLFAIWLVPGERMHGRLALAIGLSLAGVLLANGPAIARPDTGDTVWPYVLGGAAAASWAGYCALTSRWRNWAKHYAAAPMGFLLVGVIAAGVCWMRHEWHPMDGPTLGTLLLAGLGPWAGGYMLWEMALHRVSAVTLGLVAAATPVLSTLAMMGLFALTAAGRVTGTQVAILLLAAFMISVAVALGISPSPAGAPGAETEPMS